MCNSNNSELIDEAVIFEMKAKQLDLDDMKDAAQGIKYVAGYYIEIIKTFDKILVEITSRLNACKAVKKFLYLPSVIGINSRVDSCVMLGLTSYGVTVVINAPLYRGGNNEYGQYSMRTLLVSGLIGNIDISFLEFGAGFSLFYLSSL